MSQKKPKKPSGCLLPLCCGSASTKTEEFDAFEDKTLERGKILLQKEESQRKNSSQSPHDARPQSHEREADTSLLHNSQKTSKHDEEKFKSLKFEKHKRTLLEENIDLTFDDKKAEPLRDGGKINGLANMFHKKRETGHTKDHKPEESTSAFKRRPPTPKGIGQMSKGALDELKFKNIETISPQQIKKKLALLKDTKECTSATIGRTAEPSKESHEVKLSKIKSQAIKHKPIILKGEKDVDIELNSREEHQRQEQTIGLKKDEIEGEAQGEKSSREHDRENVESQGSDQKDGQSKVIIDAKPQNIIRAQVDSKHVKPQEIEQNHRAVNTRLQSMETNTIESKDAKPQDVEQTIKSQDIEKSTSASKATQDVKPQDIQHITKASHDAPKPEDTEQNIRGSQDVTPQYTKQINGPLKETTNAHSQAVEIGALTDAKPPVIQQRTGSSKTRTDAKSQDTIIEQVIKSSADATNPKSLGNNISDPQRASHQDTEHLARASKDAKPEIIKQISRASDNVKPQEISQIISRSEDVQDDKPQKKIAESLNTEKHTINVAKGVRFKENDDVIPPEDPQLYENDTEQCPIEIGNALKTFGSFTIEEEFAFIHTFGNSHLASSSSSSSEGDVRATLPRPETIPGGHDEYEENNYSMDEMTDRKLDSTLPTDQPVPPSSPILGSVEMSRPCKPQLPMEKFTFLNRNVDLPETTGGDLVPLRKGSVNTDLLGVFRNTSDSSVIANYSGSSSEPELAKLIDMKSSDEFLPTKPVFKPASLPLRESPPVIKNVVREFTSDLCDPLKGLKVADVKVSQTKLGASSLVLGPINSSSSMKTPEKNPIPKEADLTGRPPSARKLEFNKQTPILRGPSANEHKMGSNDHMYTRKVSNADLPHDMPSTSSHTSGSFVDGHSSSLITKHRTVPAPGHVQNSKTSAEHILPKSVYKDTMTDTTTLGSGSKRNVTHIPKPDIYCSSTTGSGILDTQPSWSKADQRLLHRPTQSKQRLARGPSKDMESQDNSSKSNLPEVKGATSSRDTVTNKPMASPYTSIHDIPSGGSLPSTSSGEKSRGRPTLQTKFVSSDSESDGRTSQMKVKMTSPPGPSQKQISHQPKPPESTISRSRERKYSRQRRKRPPNTKASDSSSSENVENTQVRPAWGANKRVPAPPLAPSAPKPRPPTNRVRDEDERERSSGASTSSLPGPLPPPDLLAPSLFKRRAGQGLPTVSGNVPPPVKQSDRIERQQPTPRPDGKTPSQSTRPQGSQLSKSSSRPDTRRGPPQVSGPQSSQRRLESTSGSDTRRGPPQSSGPQGSQPRLESTSRPDTRRGPPQSSGPQGSRPRLESTSRPDTRRGPPQSSGPQGSRPRLESTSRPDTRRGPPQSSGPQGSQPRLESTSRPDTKTGSASGSQGSQPRLLARRARTNQ